VTGADDIVGVYTQWTPLFEHARNVSAQLMTLCRLMTAEEEAYLASEHSNHSVQVYVNPAGEKVIRLPGARVFPEGTVIVKEKWVEDPSGMTGDGGARPAGLGIMLKHAEGFSPASGDWEYLYVDGEGTVTRDQKQLGHCIACHVANEEGDSVFFANFIFSP
jgi:hypothetical protein